MTRKYFGTDGIRGKANTPPMTPEIAMRLGMAAGRYFRRGGSRRHSVVIGKDTRLSGYMIEPALVAGFTSIGMDVTLFGPLPTPGVAMMTRSMRADLGVMISASHNGYQDNGIKLFGPDGFKLDDDIELEIEALMERALGERLAAPADLGRARRIDDSQARYVEIVKSTFPKTLNLNGLRIALDCANGAAYKVAPIALYELGADVVTTGVTPNGFNINDDVGSTHTDSIIELVHKYRADVGISLDGDADRVVLCDSSGQILDGDKLLGLVATSWKKQGRLSKPALATTVMSNLGLEEYLKKLSMKMERTRVGDRYVSERMRKKGINLGGEPSGHILMPDYSTTGDGLIAALQVLSLIVDEGTPLDEMAHLFELVPQIMRNHRWSGTNPLETEAVTKAVAEAEKLLSGKGMMVVRKSGTEPLIRVMAQSTSDSLAEKAVDMVMDALRSAPASDEA